MFAVQGYYDGTTIQALEKITAKPNQRVIITVMDEFVEPTKATHAGGIRGALSKYASQEARSKESGAWQRMAVEKYDNT